MKKLVVASVVSVVLAFAAVAEDHIYTVEAGQTETVTEAVDADEAGVSRLIKRGAGSLEFLETVGGTRNFAEMVIEAGEVILLGKASDSFKIADITVKDGAKLTAGASGPLVPTAVIDIEEGGTVDFGAYADTIDGIVGAGTLTSSGKVIKLKLTRGPHLFSGLVTGTTILEVENSGSNADYAFIVGASNTLAAAKFRMSAGGGTNLLFAAGVGCFEINEIQCGENRPLYLHDLAGEPITVFSGIYSSGDTNFKLRGGGDWFLNDSGDNSQKNADGAVFAVGHTGNLGIWKGSLCIGTQTDAGRTDFSTVKSISVFWNKFPTVGDNGSRLQIYNDNTSEWTYPCPIYGNGIIDFRGPSVLEDFRMDGGKIYAYTNLTFRGGNGGLRESPGIMFKHVNSHVIVTNGAVIGGPFVTAPALRNISKLRYHKPFGFSADDNGMFMSSALTVSGRGSTVYQKDSIPHRVYVVNGATYAVGGSIGAGYATASDPTVVLVDGAILNFSGHNGGFNVNVCDDSDKIALRIGARGALIDVDSGVPQWTDGNMNCFLRRPLESAVADGVDGGVTLIGSGHVNPYYPWTITGPFRLYDGTIDLGERSGLISATTPLFGFGDFEMGGALIRYRTDTTTSYTTRLGTGEGAKFIASGAATIRMRESVTTPKQTVEFGPLNRTKGGALFLMSTCSAADGVFDPETVGTARAASGTALSANGRLLYPAFSHVKVSSEDSFYRIGFLAYDSTNDRFTGLANTSSDLVDGKVCHVQYATNIEASATVAVEALRIDGKPLTLGTESTLKVGDGVNPACVVLNSTAYGSVAKILGGTLDFGSSEGIIAMNRCETEVISSKITGSGGLSIVGPIDSGYESLALSGDNDYTGGTYISGTTVAINGNHVFGSGKVRCVQGDISGGALWFKPAKGGGYVLANNLEIAGCGATRGDSGHAGAIHAEEGTNTVSGAVEAYLQARVTANPGTSIAFTGIISGTRLQFFDSKGDIILSAANTYTNGTEVTRSTLTLRGAGTLGTGDVLLDGGTIVFEDDTATNFANRVDGVGTLVVKDRKTVANFTNLDSEYDGLALGLADKRCTVGSLNGFSSVTNMTAAAADLYVLDGSASSFAGKVSANVTLHDGARVPPGLLLIVR